MKQAFHRSYLTILRVLHFRFHVHHPPECFHGIAFSTELTLNLLNECLARIYIKFQMFLRNYCCTLIHLYNDLSFICYMIYRQHIIVLTILGRLEFETFSCRPIMVADNTFQFSMAPPL